MPCNSPTSARTIAATSAARTPWPITSQMKTPAIVSESSRISKKSPLTAVEGLKKCENCSALSLGEAVCGKHGIAARHERVLEFARHAEIFLEFLVAAAQFLRVSRELLFRFFALRDVAREAERADDFPGLVAQRHLRRRHPRLAAIRPHFVLLLVHHRLAGADDLLLVVEGLARVLFAEEIEVRLAEHVRRIVRAEALHRLAADPDEAAGEVLEVNLVRDVLHQRAEEKALARQLLLDHAALRRCPSTRRSCAPPAPRVAIHLAARPQEMDRPIRRPDHAEFAVEIRTRLHRALHLRAEPSRGRRDGSAFPCPRAVRKIVPAVTPKSAVAAIIPKDHVARDLPIPGPDARRFERQARALFHFGRRQTVRRGRIDTTGVWRGGDRFHESSSLSCGPLCEARRDKPSLAADLSRGSPRYGTSGGTLLRISASISRWLSAPSKI